jgi:thymidylate kinase
MAEPLAKPRQDRGRPAGRLIAVEGVNGSAVKTVAKRQIAAVKRGLRGGVSQWGASGVFDDLVVAGEEAGEPSARTLVLLYAADLAFRLRWEIRPALAEGRVVAAAPYVATAVAFGRAAGLPGSWLKDLFSFAARADEAYYVDTAPTRGGRPAGFIEFGCERLSAGGYALTRKQLTDRARRQLRLSRAGPLAPT